MDILSKKELAKMRHEIIRSRNLLQLHEEKLFSLEELMNEKKRRK